MYFGAIIEEGRSIRQLNRKFVEYTCQYSILAIAKFVWTRIDFGKLTDVSVVHSVSRVFELVLVNKSTITARIQEVAPQNGSVRFLGGEVRLVSVHNRHVVVFLSKRGEWLGG